MKLKKVTETWDFKSEAECLAFIDGVEFVNDSAVTVSAPIPPKKDWGRWTVKVIEWKEVP